MRKKAFHNVGCSPPLNCALAFARGVITHRGLSAACVLRCDTSTLASRLQRAIVHLRLLTLSCMGTYTDSIGSKLDDLGKGRNELLESRHVIMIGWSAKIFSLLKQLCLGKEAIGGVPVSAAHKRGCVGDCGCVLAGLPGTPSFHSIVPDVHYSCDCDAGAWTLSTSG